MTVLLKGSIPEPPVIFCRDDEAQLLVLQALHEDWSRKPSVTILDEWPEEWQYVNAVVVTPLLVLGTEKPVSFSIIGDEQITEEERYLLNTYINLMRTTLANRVPYRDLAAATGMNRRTITALVKSLADKGIGTYKFREGFSLDIGRFVLDNERAKAAGINIKEYER